MAKNDNNAWFDIKPGYLTQEVCDRLNQALNYLLGNTNNLTQSPNRYLAFGGGFYQDTDLDYQINNLRRARLTNGPDVAGLYSWQEQASTTIGVGGWLYLTGCGRGYNNNDTTALTQPTWEANSLNPTPANVVRTRRAYIDNNIGSWTYEFDRVYQLYAADGNGNFDNDVVALTIAGPGVTFIKGVKGHDSYSISSGGSSSLAVSNINNIFIHADANVHNLVFNGFSLIGTTPGGSDTVGAAGNTTDVQVNKDGAMYGDDSFTYSSKYLGSPGIHAQLKGSPSPFGVSVLDVIVIGGNDTNAFTNSVALAKENAGSNNNLSFLTT